jgi:hypothetical protein
MATKSGAISSSDARDVFTMGIDGRLVKRTGVQSTYLFRLPPR